ncbi:MAG: hypothetical protein R3F11_28195 [Verrucomicrobiales bacterium]
MVAFLAIAIGRHFGQSQKPVFRQLLSEAAAKLDAPISLLVGGDPRLSAHADRNQFQPD